MTSTTFIPGTKIVSTWLNDVNSAVYGSNWITQTYSGNGSTFAFTLSQSPGSASNCDVAIGGAPQIPNTDYTVLGTTLTFTTAPPTGTNNIVIRYGGSFPIPLNTIQNGVIDNTPIGATTPSTVNTTALSLAGTGARITGDFSNATIANRVMFQDKTTNNSTIVGLLPNGSATESRLTLLNNSNPLVSQGADFRMTPTELQIRSNDYGAGAYLPMTFYTGGSERMRIDTSGNVGIGGTPGVNFDIVNTGNTIARVIATTGIPRFDLQYSGIGRFSASIQPDASYLLFDETNGVSTARYLSGASGYWKFYANGTQAMTLDASGNLGIGVTPSAWGSNYKSIESAGAAAGPVLASANVNPVKLTGNIVYSNGGATYKTTGEIAEYNCGALGEHQMLSGPSGTAGAAVSTLATVLKVSYNNTLSLQGGTKTAGVGIAFPATQVPSTDPNTFDDYEEGTWTPVQGSGLTLVGAFGFANAVYTKKGREVTITATLTGATSIAVGGTGILCTGLPFTVAGSFAGSATNGTVSVAATCLAQVTTVYCTPLAASVAIYFTVTYFV